jgi:hypothetical protein
MKTKKLWVVLLGIIVTFSACKYDDNELWDEVYKLQERVQKLEDLCELLNTNIEAAQEVVETIEENGVITSISPIARNSYAGYVIEFSNGKTITIYNGIDGKDGADGIDGKDGESPQLGIKDLGDGNYGWVLNGELLKDSNGNPLIVNGKDGKDGADGKDGEDGADGKDGKDGENAPLPQLKTGIELENEGAVGNWNKTSLYISVDKGNTWVEIPSNSNCNTFNKIEVKDDIVIFTLYDNSTITIPRTDGILEMLYGKWYDADGYDDGWNDYIILNPDFTYEQMKEGNVKCGMYGFDKETRRLIIYQEYTDENMMGVVEHITEDVFVVNCGHEECYYKTPPTIELSQDFIEISGAENTHIIDISCSVPFKLLTYGKITATLINNNTQIQIDVASGTNGGTVYVCNEWYKVIAEISLKTI